MSLFEIEEKLSDDYSPLEIIKIVRGIDKEEVDRYAVDNLICPICLGNLRLTAYYEPRGEHFGFPAWEEMSELVCEDQCGWINNE